MSVTKSRITVLGVVCDEESHGDLRFSSFGRRYAVLKQVLAASARALYSWGIGASCACVLCALAPHCGLQLLCVSKKAAMYAKKTDRP